MSATERWVLGRDVTSLLITGLIINDTTGVFTEDGAGSEFFGLLQQVRIINRSNEENISPMNRPFENNVDIEVATDMEVTELMRYTAGRLLRGLIQARRYVKVVIIHAGKTLTYYGKFSTYDETLQKGANTGVAMIKMIDIGTANPPAWV